MVKKWLKIGFQSEACPKSAWKSVLGSILEPSWAHVGVENRLESISKRVLKLQHFLKYFWSDLEAQDATGSDRRVRPVGGDLGEFPCGKRWASLRGNADLNDARASLTAAAGFHKQACSKARWPDLQWGCAPKAGHRAGSQREKAGKPRILQGKVCQCCPCIIILKHFLSRC